MLFGAIDELLPLLVLQVVVVPLHVQDVEVRVPVAVEVGEGRVAAPSGVGQLDLIGDVDEVVVSDVAEEATLLRALRLQVTAEGVCEADEVAAAPALLGRVHADVDEKEIEQTVVVVVEEDGAGGVADIVEARFLRDVPEVALPVVLEEDVSAAHGRDVKVRISVVVDVGERGRHADPVLHGDACRLSDVDELAVAQVLPELVASDLVDEVDVEQAVPVHVGHRDSVAVVVMVRLVVLARVVRDPVDEGDAALGLPVGEVKTVEDAELSGRLLLGGLSRRQAVGADVDDGNPDLLLRRGPCVRPSPQRGERGGREQRGSAATKKPSGEPFFGESHGERLF